MPNRGFEIWQYSEREPSVCTFPVAVGDLGIFAAKLNCRNVEAFYKELVSKWKDCTTPELLPDGTPCFYVKDLYGNIFQIVENQKVFIEQGKLTGGMAGAVIGVTDMDASVRFYRDVLGYGIIKSDTTGPFSKHFVIPDS